MVLLRRPFVPYVGLAIAVIVVFGGSLSASLHFDDYSIFSDPVLTSSSGWWQVFEPARTRPLTYLTLWVNYQLGGEDPAGYHALNLLLHLATVLLLYKILSGLVPPGVALIAAGIFGLHPIQTEPVVYVFARATLLMTFFCLLSLRLWLKGRHWWSVILFALALLAKEEAVALPLVLLLLEVTRSRARAEWKPIAAMLVLAVVAGGRVMLVLSQIPHSGAGAGSTISAFDYAATQGPVILRYFRLLLIPYGFTVDPQIAIETGWRSIAAWAAIVAAAAAAVRWIRSIPAAFWFLAGLILLLPSSSVFPADDLAADRRLYLPLIGFATSAAFLLNRARPWLPAGVVIVLAVVSVFRVQVWQTERSLWQEAVLRSPDKLRPKIQLSRTLDSGPALELLETARQSFPDDASLAAELGRRYLEAGRSGDALREFGRALALAPRDPAAHNNRGVALMNLGQQEAARGDFERALELDPCFFDARYNLLRIGVRTALPEGCRFSDSEQLSFTRNPMGR